MLEDFVPLFFLKGCKAENEMVLPVKKYDFTISLKVKVKRQLNFPSYTISKGAERVCVCARACVYVCVKADFVFAVSSKCDMFVLFMVIAVLYAVPTTTGSHCAKQQHCPAK